MPKKDKKDWEELDISEIKSAYGSLMGILSNLKKISTWMTTICLVTLGFFITVLLQIKKEPILPDKYLAIAAMLFFVISIVFGFYIRLKFETRENLRNFKTALNKFGKTIKSANKCKATKEERKLFKNGIETISSVNQGIDKATNSLLSKALFIQILIQTCALILGIILCSIYMFWYIFTI